MDLGDVWQQVIGTQPTPPDAVVLVTGLAALVLTGWQPAWRVLRGVLTIAHEGGHAAAATLTGRQLLGVRLHSDTSGLTVSRGRSTGPGMVFTLAAGYVAPSLLGLGGVALLGNGRITALLWSSIVLLGVMLLLIRNVYGVVSVVGTATVVFLLSWYGTAAVQAAFGYLLVWFLLLASPRPVLELPRLRRGGRARDSDADQLARLTGVAATGWIVLFGALTLAAAATGVYWLVPWDLLAAQ
ncbi:MAG: M50 family peptidase [Pseudonocardiaceae bacterium]|nr:M50 family peptidase [Pseudonocardiaceae bacterium]